MGVRPAEPEYLQRWRKAREILGELPKCCHTCDFYEEDGGCYRFKQKPPEEYAAYGSKDCDKYIEEAPF